MASRLAGPLVGRHFLLVRHFAREMISVGKARRCPFNRCMLGGGGRLSRRRELLTYKFNILYRPRKEFSGMLCNLFHSKTLKVKKEKRNSCG